MRLVLTDPEAAHDERLRHIARMDRVTQRKPLQEPLSTFTFSSGVDVLTPEARALLPF
jgi:hypothetical protein